MRYYDLWSSVFWLCVGASIAFYSTAFDLGLPSAPGSGFMPFLTGLAICLFSVITFFQALAQRRDRHENAWSGVRIHTLAAVMVILLLYTILLKPIGFVICTFVMIAAMVRLVASEGWPITLVSSLLGSLLSYVLFDILLKAYLPKGIFGL